MFVRVKKTKKSKVGESVRLCLFLVKATSNSKVITMISQLIVQTILGSFFGHTITYSPGVSSSLKGTFLCFCMDVAFEIWITKSRKILGLRSGTINEIEVLKFSTIQLNQQI